MVILLSFATYEVCFLMNSVNFIFHLLSNNIVLSLHLTQLLWGYLNCQDNNFKRPSDTQLSLWFNSFHNGGLRCRWPLVLQHLNLNPGSQALMWPWTSSPFSFLICGIWNGRALAWHLEQCLEPSFFSLNSHTHYTFSLNSICIYEIKTVELYFSSIYGNSPSYVLLVNQEAKSHFLAEKFCLCLFISNQCAEKHCEKYYKNIGKYVTKWIL